MPNDSNPHAADFARKVDALVADDLALHADPQALIYELQKTIATLIAKYPAEKERDIMAASVHTGLPRLVAAAVTARDVDNVIKLNSGQSNGGAADPA